MTFNSGKKSEIGSIEQPLASELTEIALDKGITFFDTADVYSGGTSEIMLGLTLGNRRKEADIDTKVRFPMGQKPNDTGLSRHHIIESSNSSLKVWKPTILIFIKYIAMIQGLLWKKPYGLWTTLFAAERYATLAALTYQHGKR
jgi:aryl-alcohol dehydrogenase-like predicted oxidoreductase